MIGTVRGDLHDIGKNLVAMMLEGAGFDVIDTGIDTHPDEYVQSAVKNGSDVIGMSALLTTHDDQHAQHHRGGGGRGSA